MLVLRVMGEVDVFYWKFYFLRQAEIYDAEYENIFEIIAVHCEGGKICELFNFDDDARCVVITE
jgi:hypothetical protein